jgi:hypothetical protein
MFNAPGCSHVPDNVPGSHTAARPFPGARQESLSDVPGCRQLSDPVRFVLWLHAPDGTAACAHGSSGALAEAIQSYLGEMPARGQSRARGLRPPRGVGRRSVEWGHALIAGGLWWRLRHAMVLLLLPGLLCLAAAIAGQALNVSGVNVPVLAGSARWFMGVLGAGLVVLALVVGVESPPREGGVRGALPETAAEPCGPARTAGAAARRAAGGGWWRAAAGGCVGDGGQRQVGAGGQAGPGGSGRGRGHRCGAGPGPAGGGAA